MNDGDGTANSVPLCGPSVTTNDQSLIWHLETRNGAGWVRQ